jgi:hypothetical protein
LPVACQLPASCQLVVVSCWQQLAAAASSRPFVIVIVICHLPVVFVFVFVFVFFGFVLCALTKPLCFVLCLLLLLPRS